MFISKLVTACKLFTLCVLLYRYSLENPVKSSLSSKIFFYILLSSYFIVRMGVAYGYISYTDSIGILDLQKF